MLKIDGDPCFTRALRHVAFDQCLRIGRAGCFLETLNLDAVRPGHIGRHFLRPDDAYGAIVETDRIVYL